MSRPAKELNRLGKPRSPKMMITTEEDKQLIELATSVAEKNSTLKDFIFKAIEEFLEDRPKSKLKELPELEVKLQKNPKRLGKLYKTITSYYLNEHQNKLLQNALEHPELYDEGSGFRTKKHLVMLCLKYKLTKMGEL